MVQLIWYNNFCETPLVSEAKATEDAKKPAEVDLGYLKRSVEKKAMYVITYTHACTCVTVVPYTYLIS